MTRSVLRPLLVLLVGAMLLTGCDAMPLRGQSNHAAQAERDYAQGHFAQAAMGFMEAAGSQRSMRDLYRLRAAEAWREEGDLERAAEALESIAEKRLDADAQTRLYLLQAEIALAQARTDDATTVLQALPAPARGRYQARYLELRAQAAMAQGDLFAAAVARAELGSLLRANEYAFNLQEIQKLLARADNDALSFGTATLSADHPLLPEAVRALEARGLPLPRRADGSTPALTSQMLDGNESYNAFAQVALLLPQGGQLGAAAEAVRDGFSSGYFHARGARPKVRIYDTGSTPEGARQALQRALDEGAQIIVGPLSREQVGAVFETGQSSRTPILALNRSQGAPPPPGSLSFAMTPEDEGIAAADRLSARGIQRVLVLGTSNDDYGQRAAQALAQRLNQSGGQVVASAMLPSSSPNYTGAIRTAIAQAGQFDAIFFTGRAQQGHLLMPQLKVANAASLPIYATSQITSGTGDARLDRELDGIEFTEAPWMISTVPGTPRRESLAALDATRGGGARLFAFGLDAFRLLGHLDTLRQNPQAVLPGATGQLRHDGFGQIVRSPAWARFRGGRIEAVHEAGLIGDELQYRR